MTKPIGRPAYDKHRRIARLLHALVAYPRYGCTRPELFRAADLDEDNPADHQKFRRDLRELRDSGWQIDTLHRSGNDYAYRLRIVDARIRATFSAEHRAELLRAAERAGLGQLYDDLDPARTEGSAHDGPDGLGVAQHAIRHRCLLRFTYRARERVLDPYDVFFSGDAWYFRGREAGTDIPVKTFRLSRATGLHADLPGTAGPIPELPNPNRDPMRQATGEPVEATVAVSESDLPEAIAYLGANGHRVLEGPDSDGSTVLAVTVTNIDAFLGRLFEMDSRVRLLGPDPVRQQARDVLVALAERAA